MVIVTRVSKECERQREVGIERERERQRESVEVLPH